MLIVLVGHKVQSGFGCVMDQNICLSGCPYTGHFGFFFKVTLCYLCVNDAKGFP